jgi:hypothetical protein
MWARYLSFLGYSFSSFRQDLMAQDQPDVEELWCRFRSDLRVKDIAQSAQSEQYNTGWDDGDVLVLLKIEADGDVMCSFEREEGGGVILFSVEYEVEAEGRGDWTDSDKSEVQSHESTTAKNRNENSSSTSLAKGDDGGSTW